ncbi:MAG: anaerobic ribonucleoside-triphosphate reductase activating protein [Candidatus Cloacimonas sp.]|jgi:pyruvate formate lyase activating enzyme|nr:anaerobic ribonucleoside-triphosphate reductase activating protein [Candidatus Cloacimonas sp.]
MKIGGFQKFSLLDYPGHLAAIVFTQGCNFRCPYCHNPALVDVKRYGQLLNTETVLRFLYRRRKKLGAVVLTGGEPTLQEDLKPFLKLLKAMRYKVKLDTNGSLPEVLQEVLDAGLVDYVAMDLKAPLHLYQLVTKSSIAGDTIKASMEIIRRSGVFYEFRNTFFDALLSARDLADMQELLRPGDKFFVQECRYGATLEAIDKPQNQQTPDSFSESAVCRELIGWGKSHHVNVSVRSL